MESYLLIRYYKNNYQLKYFAYFKLYCVILFLFRIKSYKKCGYNINTGNLMPKHFLIEIVGFSLEFLIFSQRRLTCLQNKSEL